MKHYIFLIAMTAALALPSCSVFNKVTGTSKADDKTEIAQAQTVNAPKDKKKGKNKKNKPSEPSTPSTRGEAPTLDILTGGQWSVASVGETQINAEDEQPYIAFDNDGRFYANDGCNILNGDYTIRANGNITFDHVLSTMKYCPDVETAPSVAETFKDGSVYTTDCRRIGQETYLYLKSASGKAIATLRRHNMEFLNGNWLITSAEGKNIDDEEANIFIDIPELKVHGNTGCNYFNGVIYIDPSRSNAIDFSQMGLTRMACPKGDQERVIMVALERAASAIAGKNSDTVLLLDNAGKKVMTLKKAPVSNDQE